LIAEFTWQKSLAFFNLASIASPVPELPAVERFQEGGIVFSDSAQDVVPLSAGQKIVLAALAVTGAASLIYFIFQGSFVCEQARYFVLKDDFMISMRYALNFAHGRGLVWNAGEYVEGISNLGWTVLMSLAHLFPLSNQYTSLAVIAFNCLIFLLLVLLCFDRARRLSGNWAAVVTALILVFCAPLAYYTITGSEHICQSLLISACLLKLIPPCDDYSKQCRTAGGLSFVWLALAVLIRPDALAIFALVFASCAVARAAGRSNQRLSHFVSCSQKDMLYFLLACMIIASLFCFQKLYYGDWLPNTFYLRCTGPDSLRYAFFYVAGVLLISPPFVFGVSFLGSLIYYLERIFTSKDPCCIFQGATLIFLTLAWLVCVVSVGGDWFYMGRFFLPLLPCWIVSTVVLIFALYRKTGNKKHDQLRSAAAFVVSAGTLCMLLPYAFFMTAGMEPVRVQGQTSVAIARDFEKHGLNRFALIAVHQSGCLPYFLSEYKFHDLLGLNNSTIARGPRRIGIPGHRKWNYAYSLDEIRPDLIVAYEEIKGLSDEDLRRMLALGNEFDPIYYADFCFNPSFLKHYKNHPYAVSLAPNVPFGLQLVFLRDSDVLPGIKNLMVPTAGSKR
jgi:hypothetical protein